MAEGPNWTPAAGPEIGIIILDDPAEALRALLPEAKRLCARQHRSAVWDALLAAEALLAQVDACREAWEIAIDDPEDDPDQAPALEVPEEAGP